MQSKGFSRVFSSTTVQKHQFFGAQLSSQAFFMGFPGCSEVKASACNVGDLGWEDPLEEGMTTYSSILTWRIFHLVKGMVFPVVMYGCESWTIKKAECQRIDAFELWC